MHFSRPALHVFCSGYAFHRVQAHERLTAMNDPAKGGSAYLQQKVTAARDALVEAPPESKEDGK